MNGFSKKRRIRIVLFIQAMILLFLFVVSMIDYKYALDLKIPLTDWQSKYINYREGWYIDESIIETNDMIDMIYGPYTELKRGTYTINIEYECNEDQGCLVYANCGNDKYIKTKLETLQKEKRNISYDFLLTKNIDNLEVVIKYNGKGALKIKGIHIVPSIIGMQRKTWITLYLILLLDGCVYLGNLLWKSNFAEKNKRIIGVVLRMEAIIAIFLILIVSVQYLRGKDLKIDITDWNSKYINYRMGGWYVDENIIQTDEIIDIIYGPYIELKKGIYTIRIDYECEEDQGCLAYANSGNDVYIDTSLETLRKNKKSISYNFVLSEDIDNFETVIKYNGKGALIIKNIRIKESILSFLKKQTSILGILLLGNICIVLIVLCRRTVLFSLGLCVILAGAIVAEEACVDSGKTSWTEMKEIHDHPDLYDVCFLGPSTAQTNISNQELYEQYGIAGISLADGLEPIYVSRYVLEEMLQYQTPQVVFYDTNPLFYSDETNRNWAAERKNFLLYDYLNGIKSLSVRAGAFKAIQKYNHTIDAKDFIKERLENGRQNWKNILKFDLPQNTESVTHGNLELMGVDDSFKYTYNIDDSEIIETIDKDTKQYLSEMIKVCKESNVEFVLLTETVNFTKAKHDAVSKLAEEYKVKYIDINNYIKKIDISFNENLNDWNHLNLSGAIKVSGFLGEYLSNNYEITDKRNNPDYKMYEERKRGFQEKREATLELPFREYLKKLTDLNKKEYMIFASAYGEASVHLEDSDTELLKELGIETDLMGQAYNTTSDYQLDGESGSIELNGVKYMQRGDGFYFVTCNRKTGQIEDSLYFNTCDYKNPFGVKMKKVPQ